MKKNEPIGIPNCKTCSHETHKDTRYLSIRRIFDTHFRPQNWRIMSCMWFELHGPLTGIRRECREHFPRRLLQRKPLVSDPGMHHGTCVTHVPWCMSWSLTRSGAENVPGIPSACVPAILRIWQEANCDTYYWCLPGLCQGAFSQWCTASGEDRKPNRKHNIFKSLTS